MTVYTIRTADGRPIMFDPEIQITNDGPIELHFPIREYAIKMLEEMRKIAPEQEFVIVKQDLDKGDILFAMTEEDIHRKAQEEQETLYA
jgi:hypothetical protein